MDEHPTEQLSAYIDGDLSAADRKAIERHLGECPDCRAVAADLERIVAQASALPPRPPSRDLWPDIAARLEEPVVAATRVYPIDRARRRSRSTPRRFSFSVPELVAAGLALVLLSGGAAWWVRSGEPRAASESRLQAEASPEGYPGEPGGTLVADGADESYASAIGELERAFAATRDRLDPETVRAVESNLAIIDAAIGQTEEALRQDPNSVYLYDHLAATRRQKMEVLRSATRIVQVSI